MTRDDLLKQPPTDEQIETSLRRIATGKVRRCIPVEPDDDDVVLSNAIEHLRERARRAEQDGRRAAFEEAERYVRAQLGTFQGAGGPVKMVDSALRLVADGIRELRASPPPAATETTEPKP